MGYFYEISGVELDSEIALLSLPHRITLNGPGPGLRVRVRIGSPKPFAGPVEWIVMRTYHDVAVPYLSVARLDAGYLVRIHDQVDFHVNAAGTEIVCSPIEGLPARTLEQLLLDQILPQVLQLLGRPSLHASAVALRSSHVIAFLGRSGMGKSTLAASFAVGSAPDGAIVSDDCLALSLTARGVEVHPSCPSTRLRHDAARALLPDRELSPTCPRTAKLRVDFGSARGELVLARAYVLEAADSAPIITRLSRRDGIAALATHLHRMDPDDRRRLTDELGYLETIVNHVTVARLGFRRRFDELPAVRAAIRADIGSAAA